MLHHWRSAFGLLGCVLLLQVSPSIARRLHAGKAAELQGRLSAVARQEDVSQRHVDSQGHGQASANILNTHLAARRSSHEAKHIDDPVDSQKLRNELEDADKQSKPSTVQAPEALAAGQVMVNISSHAESLIQGAPTVSLEMMQNNPVDSFGWIFFAFVLLFFVKVFLCDAVPAEKWNEVCEQHDELTNTYDREVDKLINQLESIANDATVLAESSFKENQRDIQRVMDRMVHSPTQPNLDPSRTRLIQQFRGFILSWLKIVEQCSLDPVKEPRHLCSEVALRRATNVIEMAQAVGERCKNTHLSLIGEDVNATSRLRQMLQLDDVGVAKRSSSRQGRGDARCCFFMCRWLKWECGFGIEVNPDEEDGPYPFSIKCAVLRITLFSFSHIVAIAGFFLGIDLIIMFAMQQKPLLASAAGIAVVLLIILLCQMDQLDMRHLLGKEIRYLKDKATAVARRRENVLMSYKKMQDLTLLWRYQTLPRLENFMTLLELMRDMAPDTQEQMLGGVVERLEELHLTMGDISLWIGEEALSEQVLAQVASQIDACTKIITKNMRKKKAIPYILHHLHHCFGFLVIRIVACHDLPARNSGAVYVLIVQGKGADEDSQQFKTRSMNDIVNPRWKTQGGGDYEEFQTAVSPDTRSVTMQVLGDKQSDKRAENKVARFGFLVANFRQEPGKWVRARELLFDAKTHKQQSQGEIQYEIFFANRVAHFDLLRKEGSPATIDDFLSNT